MREIQGCYCTGFSSGSLLALILYFNECSGTEAGRKTVVTGRENALCYAFSCSRKDTWALTTRHPAAVLTQVWLCRPILPDSRR